MVYVLEIEGNVMFEVGLFDVGIEGVVGVGVFEVLLEIEWMMGCVEVEMRDDLKVDLQFLHNLNLDNFDYGNLDLCYQMEDNPMLFFVLKYQFDNDKYVLFECFELRE